MDSQRIGAWGGSAGAYRGLRLALSEDMFDPLSGEYSPIEHVEAGDPPIYLKCDDRCR